MTQQQTRIRYQHYWYLIFWFLVADCKPRENNNDFTIQWEKGKAISVYIPDSFLDDDSSKSGREITLNIKDYEVEIFGEIVNSTDGVIFRPLIPFTRGMSYDIRARQKLIGSFRVPLSDSSDFPAIVAVYPQADTVPANLLKWYIRFSQPMQEAVAGEYIHLVRNGTDTLKDVFLDLQPELWDHEQNVLTVWMDPGRIKRGLQPNIRLGPPMNENEQYQLLIDSSWRDIHGNHLRENFSKAFVTESRDTISPDPGTWKIIPPKAETKDAIQIQFRESLDHMLLGNTVVVSDEQYKSIAGKWNSRHSDRELEFIPEKTWQKGLYRLLIQSRLEDLAGNNLNRLFDQEVSIHTEKKSEEEYRLNFRIE